MSARNRRTPAVSAPEDSPWAYTRRGRMIVSAFILFHLVAIASFCLPFNTLLLPAAKNAVRPYMLWSGLFQSWDMFAPDPRKTNLRVGAEVTFRDGQTRAWRFPAMQELSYGGRYAKERYRKYSNDNLRLDENSALWPDAAAYIARLNYSDPSNPPVGVQLVRSWSDVALWESGGEPWHSYMFFRYKVAPGDLR